MALARLGLAMTLSLGLAAQPAGPGAEGPRLDGPGRECPPPPKGPGPISILRFARALDLSVQQISQLKAVADKHGEALEFARDKVRRAEGRLMEASENPELKPEALRVLADKASAAHLEELMEGHGLLRESFALLTPEQHKKLAQLMAEGPVAPPRPPKGGFDMPRPEH